jgi:hypothetical protein
MKFRWFSLFFGSFALHFQMKLSTHGSNLNSIFVIMSELEFFLLTGVLTQNFNSIFVIMSELEFFLLTGVLTQNFNTVDLVKFLEKIQKLHI